MCVFVCALVGLGGGGGDASIPREIALDVTICLHKKSHAPRSYVVVFSFFIVSIAVKHTS